MNDPQSPKPSSRTARRAALLSALSATLTACSAAPSRGDPPKERPEETGTHEQAQVVPFGSTDVTPYLGWGYDSAKQNFLGGCMYSDNTLHVGQPTSHLVFDTSLSQDKLESELGGDIDAKAHFGAWKASASANFLRTATSDAYSISFVYSATYDFGSAVIDPATLHFTGVGTSAQNGGFWPDACGDQAVTQIRQGARFYLVIRVDFSSKEVKQEFAAKVGLEGAFGSVTADMKNNADVFKSSAKIHVEVFQVGGDVSRISGVFGSAQTDQLLPAVACDLGNLPTCTTFMNTALAYGTDVNGAGTFPTQLAAGPADLSYVTQDWATLGVQQTPDILSDELKDNRLRLHQYYDVHADYRRRVERLLDNDFVSGSALVDMVAWRDKLAAQDVQINDVVTACYDDVDQKNLSTTVGACTVKVDGISTLPHPDPTQLDSYGPEGGVVKRWVELGGAQGPLGSPISGFSQYGGTAWMQEYQGGAIISQPGAGSFSVQGPIWTEIKPHSQPTDPVYVGFPTEEQHPTPDGKGTMQGFTNGVVYSIPGIGTMAIPTGILTYLNAHGGVASWGYPSADPSGGQGGHIYQRYPRGGYPAVIHYKPKLGAFTTGGLINATYFNTPSPTTNLGAPIEEERATPSMQHFERGAIVGHNGYFAVYAAIGARWSQTGEGSGYGLPTESMTAAGCQAFDVGTFCNPVAFSKVTHAPIVVGAIRGKWNAMGRETGTLGHPITDENATSDGGGRVSEFQNGAIVWRSVSGALYSPADVYALWVSSGSGTSCLGFPTADYSATTKQQSFQHGRIAEEKPTDPRDHRAQVPVVHCN